MDEDSDSRLWTTLRHFFSRKGDCHLEEAIQEAKNDGELQNEEMSMLLNVLQLDDKQAYEIMIPRTEIICAEIDESINDVARKFFESGHSRLPIYKETKDQVVGILHCKELLRFFVDEEISNPDLGSVLRTPYFIPETKNVRSILLDFQSNKQHMAIVLDEYGGTAGLVTLEDVLEEIVGDIEDEYDPPRPEEIQVEADGSFLVSGRTTLEDLHEEGTILLDSEQVETVGGYIIEQLGRVPLSGESLEAQGYSFFIKEADPKQIQWVLIAKSES
ncbi:MAG: hemolysin family protein [Desulfomicrobium sp.]|jgi:magnesium and cobalt transporter|nr:hemolysin family protein [Desulfomicrobium sp.]NLV97572.1 HlyC/CorC family transporter [Desulfovibrionales bacterium]